MSERRVRLDHLLGVYRVGSGGWSWYKEYDKLIRQTDTQKLLARIRNEGIREPILLGTDGRVWDGHHRIVIAMHLGMDSVPVEFAGEEGALAAHNAEVRAATLSEQGTEELEGEHVFIERYGVYHAKFGGIGGDVTSLGLTREAWKAMGEPDAVAVSVSPVEQGADDERS